jgi:hypothetical protein
MAQSGINGTKYQGECLIGEPAHNLLLSAQIESGNGGSSRSSFSRFRNWKPTMNDPLQAMLHTRLPSTSNNNL